MYAILKECPLFRGLTAAQIEDILADKGKYALSEYRDGDLIAQRDTAYSGLMIIIKGKVHGKMTYASGRSADIEPIEAPQLIAPAFLFGGYNKLPIDVIADGDVTIMTIHRGYIFELMQNNVVIMSNFVDIRTVPMYGRRRFTTSRSGRSGRRWRITCSTIPMRTIPRC